MIKKLLILMVLFPLFTLSATAKKGAYFSGDTEAFIKELGDYVKQSKNKQLLEVYHSFQKKYTQGVFNNVEIASIIETSNLFIERKLRANPFFKDYLMGLNEIKKTKDSPKHFAQWHKVLSQLLSDGNREKVKRAKKMLAFSPGFFAQQILKHKKGKLTWQAQAASFDLLCESDRPCVRFSALNLVVMDRRDSLQILETKGTFCPITQTWKGAGGKVWWNQEGMEEVYCTLTDYQFQLKKGAYSIESVNLHYPNLFPGKSVKGKLVNKIISNNRVSAEGYPRFESSEKVLEINHIGERINYTGGFRLHGSTYFGYGDAEQKAEIEIFNQQNELVFRGRSAVFKMKTGERISGEQVEAVLFYGQDSIYHPSVNLKYNIQEQVLNLYRGKRGSDRSPFYDSYHQVNINTDKLDWDINTGIVNINEKHAKFGNGNQRVTFESLDYFDIQTYRKFQNVANTNPIATLKLLVKQEGKNIFAAEKLAQKLNPNFDVTSIKSLLYDLLAEGFIEYDAERQLVKVRAKTLHFADASQKKKDFDLIKYVSVSDQTNALLDVKSGEIVARKVDLVEFSNRQKVAAKPFMGDLTLLKDRDISFAGKLFAGYATMNGKDFQFNYERNEIQMDSIRFFDLFVPTGKKINGEMEALSIASRIEHTNGVLLVDAPGNKSGSQDIPMFPSFNTQGPAYVYYDHLGTQDACYHRDSFYFELDPFSLNGLDNFSAADLKFKGKIISASIFEEIEETLVLQEDHSLGFVTETPATGLSTYEGKGTFTGKMSLSNTGFMGKGEIKYKWATLASDDIVFKPQQLLSTAEEFNLTEERSAGVEIPQVRGEEVVIDWKPYTDSMYVQSKSAPFQLFKSGDYTLKDMLILTPDGLKGRGVFDWEKGQMSAPLYTIGANSIQSDTVNLVIRATGLDHLALDTRNVYSRLDFDKKIGTVGANADTVETILPYNTYITSLNEFDWDMDNETITFMADETGRGSFRSIHPEQDSLRFYGNTAFYDLKTYELKLGGVEMIETADANVYPGEGKLEIQKGGLMSTLHNARIVANRKNQYHVINRATVDIQGRKAYRAKGFYEYNLGDRQQEFELNEIIGGPVGKGKKSKRKVKTVGRGSVGINDGFYIDHNTLFHGTIALDAEQQALQFDGFAQLDAPLLPNRQWFSISSLGDKNDLHIAYQEPKNLQGQTVRTGLFVNSLKGQTYPAIMMAPLQGRDRAIFETQGLFTYRDADETFLFGDSLKVVADARHGNKLSFNNRTGEVYAEGRFSIGNELDYAELTVVGQARTKVQTTDEPMRLEVVAGLDLYVPEKLLKIMLNDIQANAYEARNVKYLERKDFYNQVLAELIPAGKDYANTKAKMLNYGLELPEKYNPFTFLFTDLYLHWNPEMGAFQSSRKKIGLASIGETAINKMLDCYLECRMPANGSDRFTLYLVSPGGQFYFFDYKQGVLSTASNNEDYNETAADLKSKEATRKMKDGELYEVQLVGQSKAKYFLQRMGG